MASATEYNKDSLIHFGYIFSPPENKPELQNLTGKIMQLCLPKSSIQWKIYVPIKTIKFIRVVTPKGTGTGDRSGGRGKILYYTEDGDTTEKSITYGKDPDWLKDYNKINDKYYGTDSIYVNIIESTGGKSRKNKSKKHRKSMKKSRRKSMRR